MSTETHTIPAELFSTFNVPALLSELVAPLLIYSVSDTSNLRYQHRLVPDFSENGLS